MSRLPVDNVAPVERAVLFGALIGGAGTNGRTPGSAGDPEAALDELAGLAEAVDVEVVGRMVQRLARPVSATHIGSGKVAELKTLIKAEGANLALADMDLSPAQARNLTEALGVRVIDRSELIMDIFARRARTSQAKLQVELAQLEYALPRLRGQWTHLDRYGGGGVGTRGPGEKQIETDRRIVNLRIRDLKRRLTVFERRKQVTLAGRAAVRKVALAGYTNTGKSTLFNRLTGAETYVADRLFATLDTRTRRWALPQGPLPQGGEVLLSDTVGFIRDLPHHLVASFHATLEEVIEADLILHVVDASDPEAHRHMETVRRVMQEIGAGEIPTILVVNKVDRVSDRMELQALLNGLPGALPISAATGEGLDLLAERVARAFRGVQRRYRVSVPLASGRALAQVRALADVIQDDVVEDGGSGGRIDMVLQVEQRHVGRLKAWAEDEGLDLQRA